MEFLTQTEIDALDIIAARYKCDLLLPPTTNLSSVALCTQSKKDLIELTADLLMNGFTLIHHEQEGKTFVEITGVDYG